MSLKKQIQGKKDTPAKKGPPTPTKVRPLVKLILKKTMAISYYDLRPPQSHLQ